MKRNRLFATLAALAALAGCGGKSGPAPTPELALRRQLGIPDEAKTVIVFGQSAHLDIDWQKTFSDYYQTWVEGIFLDARKLLAAQPRAFYSVTEMAYLERHLMQHPEERAPLAAAVTRGALHVVGGGLTSPDTLLPEGELLARDFLYGIRFAEDQLGAHPRAAYLPDSFGHAGTVPDVLAAAGFDSVAFGRVDGSPDFFDLLRDPSGTPVAGTFADKLRQLGSADFVWRGPGGGEVLAHFLASHLYCQGDNIDYAETLQVPGGHLGLFSGDDPAFTDGRIDEYLAALAPYAKTGYRFVPIGCDFQSPNSNLIQYLDGYNQRRYPHTGAWAVAAPFDLYAELLAFHRRELPTLTVSPAPHYSGFFGSRATLKRRVREAARPLQAAETFAAALDAVRPQVTPTLSAALHDLALSNHHDFVTGTSVDGVVGGEQLPLLDRVEQAGRGALAQVTAALAAATPGRAGARARYLVLNAAAVTRDGLVEVALPSGGNQPLRALAGDVEVPSAPLPGGRLQLLMRDLPPLAWRVIELVDGAPAMVKPVEVTLADSAGQPASGDAVQTVTLANEHVRAVWSRAERFALTSLVIDGRELIAAPSFTIADYADQGGLYRLGHEMAPRCSFTRTAPPAGHDSVGVLAATPLAATVAFTDVDGVTVREAHLEAAAAALDLALTTAAARATTRTVAFTLAVSGDGVPRTAQPFGFAERADAAQFAPTFWPATEWAALGETALLLRQSTGARVSRSGELEVYAVRNAVSEMCSVTGADGNDDGPHRLEWRLARAAGPFAAAGLAQAFGRPLVIADAGAPPAAPTLPAERSLARVDGDALITALKPAERGDGVIVRVLLGRAATLHLAPPLAGRTLGAVDLAERDLAALGTAGESVALDPAARGAIVSLRLR